MKTFPIYPASFAAMLVDCAGQKYQPSNGTEGEIFMSGWCCECARDLAMRECLPIEECDDSQKCDIIALTHCYSVEDERYPKEWQYGKDGQPCCTAFVPAGQPIPVPDLHTRDLFEGDAS